MSRGEQASLLYTNISELNTMSSEEHDDVTND